MIPGVDYLGLFVAAGLLLNLTPGPDVVYIVGHGLRHGARAGLVAALGITAGCFVHVGAAALGVTALVAASASAFTALKLIGAAYLVWLGLRMLLSRASALTGGGGPQSAGSAIGPAARLGKVFWGGFLTNVLNPKVALFFLAFLPQFIAADAPSKLQAFLLLGLLFNFNGLWVNGGYALLAAWLAQRLDMVQRAMRWLERAIGLLLFGYGCRLAIAEYPNP